MQVFHLAQALLPDGWAAEVRLEVGPDGTIQDVARGVAGEGAERLSGLTLPGLVDLHCHAFQRAMAGLTERLDAAGPSFWGWRQVMYGFLARIGPDELGAIAAQLYVELLKGGYTTVCEFHYLHNDPAGRAYDDPALLAVVLHEAAAAAGIGLTLLPSLYMTGGFGRQPPEPLQRRFVLSPDRYLDLLGRLNAVFADEPGRRLGLAPHSLRAVPPELIGEVVDAYRRRDPYTPIHLHVAEQEDEVSACRAWSGTTPGRLLLDRVTPDHHWCLVHGTHLDEAELAALAGAGVVFGLCPTTEANLGDGVFNLPALLAKGGRFGIGSDSNMCRNWVEELRLLEYGQRLVHRRRAVAASPAEPSPGKVLLTRAIRGGAQASGRLVGLLAPGARADLVVLDTGGPVLTGRRGDGLADSLIFASDVPPVRHVMVGGHWRIRDGSHAAERGIADAYRHAMRRMTA